MSVSNRHFISESLSPHAAFGFMDTSKNHFDYVIYSSNNTTRKIFKQYFNGLVQLGELLAILIVLRNWPEPISTFSDSQYATSVTKSLLLDFAKPSGEPLYLAMIQLQTIIEKRFSPFYIQRFVLLLTCWV